MRQKFQEKSLPILLQRDILQKKLKRVIYPPTEKDVLESNIVKEFKIIAYGKDKKIEIFLNIDKGTILKYLGNKTKKIIPYLFLGVFIAGILMPLISDNFIIKYVGKNNITGNLFASLFGSVMYFSTLTEIPILQTFILKGIAKGPALALLLAGLIFGTF